MSFLMSLMISLAFPQARASDVDSALGSLIYSAASDGGFSSLVYRARSGSVVRAFEDGLVFNYDDAFRESYLSFDNSYSVVHFSMSGELSGDGGTERLIHKMYLCAFVRMSDGCVVSVDVGEQCGGEWRGPKQWSSSLSSTNKSLLATAPNIESIYKSYASGRKDKSQVFSPKIHAYFLEGTTFDNVLACDPPSEANKMTYIDLLIQLQRDGDVNNFKKLREVLGVSGLMDAGEVPAAF